MSQHKRAILVANFGTIRRVPADILARLRDDLLGSKVYARVATLQSYDDATGVAFIVAELSSDLEEDIAELAQSRLNEIYGEAPVEDADQESEDEGESESDEEQEEVSSGNKEDTESSSDTTEPQKAEK